MDLQEFLHGLHFNVDQVRPADHEVDWEDAPLPYKLYQGLPVIPLSAQVPLSLEGLETSVQPDLLRMGHFLWYVFGLTQVSQSVVFDDMVPRVDVMNRYRRFVPSGGALYPSELYIYLKLEDLPAGLYHYDVAHHRLVLLRQGDFNAYLEQALGHRCSLSPCFGTVFVSTMFWKNFFKYHNFAYRLQGLDAGALIGQLLEVAKRFGYTTGVFFQFLDQALNHLLGLSAQEESVYAVIPLSVEPVSTWFQTGPVEHRTVSAAELCSTQGSVYHDHYVRSHRILRYPMLTQLNSASMLDSTVRFQRPTEHKRTEVGAAVLPLPHVERMTYDFASACRLRHSPEANFVLAEVSQLQLSALLNETTTANAYLNDVGEALEPHVSLNCCLYNVHGIANGAYQYEQHVNALRPIRPGDHRSTLQSAMSMHNVNLYQVPVCIHIVGHRHHRMSALGYRGYRIQQMEAGMLVQRLLLAASAMGLAGHPLLGFDVSVCDAIYTADTRNETCLIQVPVGPHRLGSRLEAGLHG